MPEVFITKSDKPVSAKNFDVPNAADVELLNSSDPADIASLEKKYGKPIRTDADIYKAQEKVWEEMSPEAKARENEILQKSRDNVSKSGPRKNAGAPVKQVSRYNSSTSKFEDVWVDANGLQTDKGISPESPGFIGPQLSPEAAEDLDFAIAKKELQAENDWTLPEEAASVSAGLPPKPGFFEKAWDGTTAGAKWAYEKTSTGVAYAKDAVGFAADYIQGCPAAGAAATTGVDYNGVLNRSKSVESMGNVLNASSSRPGFQNYQAALMGGLYNCAGSLLSNNTGLLGDFVGKSASDGNSPVFKALATTGGIAIPAVGDHFATLVSKSNPNPGARADLADISGNLGISHSSMVAITPEGFGDHPNSFETPPFVASNTERLTRNGNDNLNAIATPVSGTPEQVAAAAKQQDEQTSMAASIFRYKQPKAPDVGDVGITAAFKGYDAYSTQKDINDKQELDDLVEEYAYYQELDTPSTVTKSTPSELKNSPVAKAYAQNQNRNTAIDQSVKSRTEIPDLVDVSNPKAKPLYTPDVGTSVMYDPAVHGPEISKTDMDNMTTARNDYKIKPLKYKTAFYPDPTGRSHRSVKVWVNQKTGEVNYNPPADL